MSIDFICTGCSKTLRVPDEHLGKQARCPQCQTLNTIQPSFDNSSTATSNSNSWDQGPTNPFRVEDKPAVSTNPYQASDIAASGNRFQTPHRGALILTLGIVSLLCNFFFVPGILAWVLGRNDLAQMKAGVMDREGQGLTQAGMILGIIATCFIVAIILFYAAIFLFAIIISVANA